MTDSNDNLKVLLPIIRKVIPQLVAEEIVGVQPMMNSERITIGNGLDEDGNVIYYYVIPYIQLDLSFRKPSTMRQRSEEISAWCVETYGESGSESGRSGRWFKRDFTFCFWDETDRDMFILRWS